MTDREIPFTAPEPRPIDGPRWVANAVDLVTEQVDARGVRWEVLEVREGGRVLIWKADSDGAPTRMARTEAAPGHPEYPSDEAVLAWTRKRRREGLL